MSSTTVHIPAPLLQIVDARAKEAGISRNRFILQALERAVGEQDAWNPAFFAQLRRAGAAEAEVVDQMMADIVASRRSKPPIDL